MSLELKRWVPVLMTSTRVVRWFCFLASAVCILNVAVALYNYEFHSALGWLCAAAAMLMCGISENSD